MTWGNAFNVLSGQLIVKAYDFSILKCLKRYTILY